MRARFFVTVLIVVALKAALSVGRIKALYR